MSKPDAIKGLLDMLRDAYVEGYFKGQLNEWGVDPDKEFKQSNIKQRFDILFPNESDGDE